MRAIWGLEGCPKGGERLLLHREARLGIATTRGTTFATGKIVAPLRGDVERRDDRMVPVLQTQDVYLSALELEERQCEELPLTKAKSSLRQPYSRWTAPRRSAASSSQENVCFTPGRAVDAVLSQTSARGWVRPTASSSNRPPSATGLNRSRGMHSVSTWWSFIGNPRGFLC